MMAGQTPQIYQGSAVTPSPCLVEQQQAGRRGLVGAGSTPAAALAGQEAAGRLLLERARQAVQAHAARALPAAGAGQAGRTALKAAAGGLRGAPCCSRREWCLSGCRPACMVRVQHQTEVTEEWQLCRSKLGAGCPGEKTLWPAHQHRLLCWVYTLLCWVYTQCHCQQALAPERPSRHAHLQSSLLLSCSPHPSLHDCKPLHPTPTRHAHLRPSSSWAASACSSRRCSGGSSSPAGGGCTPEPLPATLAVQPVAARMWAR